MRRFLFVSSVALLTATGCSSVNPQSIGNDAAKLSAPAKCVVHVFADDDEVTVSHEPVRAKYCAATGNRRKIAWIVAGPGAADYQFGQVRFKDNPPKLDCAPQPSNRRFECSFDKGDDAKPATYRYGITLKSTRGKPDITVDPTMIN